MKLVAKLIQSLISLLFYLRISSIYLFFSINFLSINASLLNPKIATQKIYNQTLNPQDIQPTQSTGLTGLAGLTQTDSSQLQTQDQLPEVDITLEEPQAIKILPLESPAGITLERLTLDIPLIGQVTLNPEKDPKTGEDILRATLGYEKSKISLGPLSIFQGQIIMRPGNKITIDAKTTLFGKEANLSLQDLTRTSKLENAAEDAKTWQIGRVHFRLKFIDQPTITITPEQKIKLTAANLIIERNKPVVTLYANIRLFGQPVKLNFDLSKKFVTVGFSMKKPIKLSSIIKSLRNSYFKDIIFKNIDFTTSKEVSQNISQDTEIPSTTFAGIVDFSSLFKLSEKTKTDQDQTDKTDTDVSGTDQSSTDQTDLTNKQQAEQETKFNFSQLSLKEQQEIKKEQENQDILTPSGPVNPQSKKAFDYFRSKINPKYVTPAETTSDAIVIEDKSAQELAPTDDQAGQTNLQTDQTDLMSTEPIKSGTDKFGNITDITRQNKLDKTRFTDKVTQEAATTDDTLTDLDTPVNNLALSATYNKKEGLHFEALVANLQLPIIERVKDAKFVFDYKSGVAPKLLLSGSGKVNISEIGTLDYTLMAKYRKSGFSLEALINNEINFQGVKLSQARLLVKPKRRVLIISGVTSIKSFGLNLNANIEIKPDKETKKNTISFDANVDKDSFKPFANTGISAIQNFEVEKLKAGLKLAKQDTGSAEIYLTGKSNILKVNADVEVRLIRKEDQSGVLLKAKLPPNWKLTDSIPNLPGFFDFKFKRASFLISSINNYIDPVTELKINSGLTLDALTGLKNNGDLDSVYNLLGRSIDNINLYGTLSTNPQNVVLGAKLTEQSGGLPSKTSKVSAGAMALELRGLNPATNAPSFGILTTIHFNPSNKDNPLDFVGRIEIAPPTDAIFAASMVGDWQNPFGLRGLTISNLALQLGINIPQFAETGLPRSIGFHGEISVGKKLLMAAQFDSQFKQMALMGKLDSLSLADIVTFLAKPIGARIPSSAVPNIEIKNLEVKFAPQDVRIGEFIITQGITVKGELTIIKSKAIVDCNISPSGIKALGYTDKINLGPLHITASKPADNPKTGGPIIDLELNQVKQEFLLSGKIDLEKIFTVDSYMKITTSGINFYFDANLANMFLAHVAGESSGPIDNPDIKLIIDLRQRFIDYIISEVNKQLSIAQKEIKEKIGAAQDQVRTIDSAIERSDRDIRSAQNAVDSAQDKVNSINNIIAQTREKMEAAQQEVDKAREKIESINSAIEEADAKLQAAKDALEEAREKVNSINTAIEKVHDGIRPAKEKVESIMGEIRSTQNKINDLKDQYGRLNWYEYIYEPIRITGEIAFNSAKLAGLYAAYGVAKGALLAAEGSGVGALIAAKESARGILLGAEEFVNQVARNVAKGTLIGAREAARGVLQGAIETVRHVGEPITSGTLMASREAANAALIAAKGTLEGAKQISRGSLLGARGAAMGTLEAAKQSGVYVLEAGKWVVKGLIGAIQIKHAHFEGSVRSIEHGRLPDIQFDISIFGADRQLNFTFDFTNPAESAVSIARALVNLVRPPGI